MVNKLTEKESKFIDYLIEGYNGADAIRKIDPNNKNPKRSAYYYRCKPHVKLELERRRKDIAKKSDISLESQIRDLEILKQAALENPTRGKNGFAIVNCIKEQNKLLGLYPEEGTGEPSNKTVVNNNVFVPVSNGTNYANFVKLQNMKNVTPSKQEEVLDSQEPYDK